MCVYIQVSSGKRRETKRQTGGTEKTCVRGKEEQGEVFDEVTESTVGRELFRAVVGSGDGVLSLDI